MRYTRPKNIRFKDRKYIETIHALSDEKEHFLNTLSENDCERFKRLDDLYYEVAGMYSYECFAHGFRLGVALITEVLTSNDDLARNDDEK